MVCMRVPVAGYACCLSCRTRNSDRHAQKLWDARVERENSYREGVHLGDRNKRYPLVDVEEAAQMLGVPVRRIYRLIEMGQLTPVLREGGVNGRAWMRKDQVDTTDPTPLGNRTCERIVDNKRCPNRAAQVPLQIAPATSVYLCNKCRAEEISRMQLS